MVAKINLWIKNRYQKVLNSIAFYPAFIGLLFLIVSFFVIQFDYSDAGKDIKSRFDYLTLKDASTARAIISAIAAGILSLTVFSFSMVMIVLNQAASQMSNRVLDKLIGNRFQQVVLGIYIGTIVYALFLLSTIRDIDAGIYIPAISTYLLILITIFDIFLFIYFLHYITQSVKYKVIIERIYNDTKKSLEDSCKLRKEPAKAALFESDHVVKSTAPGIYTGFDKRALVKICREHDCCVFMIHTPGTFVLEGVPLFKLNKQLPGEAKDDILKSMYIDNDESIDQNFFFGFRQLSEVAVKALSPGINDPGTAIESLRALFRLYAYRVSFFPDSIIVDEDSNPRIILQELTYEKIFVDTLLPIWDYGKNDRMIQNELFHLLTQLQVIHPNSLSTKFMLEIKNKMQQQTPLIDY